MDLSPCGTIAKTGFRLVTEANVKLRRGWFRSAVVAEVGAGRDAANAPNLAYAADRNEAV